jgi:hypothetical protein
VATSCQLEVIEQAGSLLHVLNQLICDHVTQLDR